MNKLIRVFHPYTLWEDYQNGMYAEKKDGQKMFRINEAILLLQFTPMLYDAMSFISRKWIHAAEVNLTNRGCNRQAWLGQAACNYATDATESEVREAWGMLSQEERDTANEVADRVIAEWEHWYLGGKKDENQIGA